MGCNGCNQVIHLDCFPARLASIPFFSPTVYNGAYFIDNKPTLHSISQISLVTGVHVRLLILEADIPVNVLANRLTLDEDEPSEHLRARRNQFIVTWHSVVSFILALGRITQFLSSTKMTQTKCNLHFNITLVFFVQAFNVEETIAISSQVMNTNNARVVLEEVLKVGNVARNKLPKEIDKMSPADQVGFQIFMTMEEKISRNMISPKCFENLACNNSKSEHNRIC